MYFGGTTAWFTLALSFLFSTAALAAPADVSLGALKVEIRAATPKYVVAHFMVGIVPNYVVADWMADMAYAQEIGIDAFALNCASVDWYTPFQLANAYEAAAQMGFLVFISFDFSYWNNKDTAQITTYMNQYAAHPAQMQYNGGAVVSTFVGDTFDWGPVKAGTNHKLFAIPNQIDPNGASYLKTSFDGVFSWYAWPTTGNNVPSAGPMTTVWDTKFLTSLAGKPYMAPLSPWFSPHFSNKNWVFACEELITDRWNQMLTMKPNLIQVVSWNDYGEGHYIGPWAPNHSDDGSSQWAVDFPHDGWRVIMKPYIAAYKSGASTPTVTQEQLVYWYRPTPKNTVCSGDPVGPSNGTQFLADDVFVTTLLKSPAVLVVTSGTKAPVSINVPAGIITSNIPMGVGTQSFVVKRNGVTILSGVGGRSIVNTCVFYNFNAYVGSVNGTITDPTSSSSTTIPVTSSTSDSISVTSLSYTTSSISSFASTISVTSFSSGDPVISSPSSIPVSSTMISEPSASYSSTLSSPSSLISSMVTSSVGPSSTSTTPTSTPPTTSKATSSSVPTSLKTTTILSSTPSVSKTTTQLISVTTKSSSLITSIKTTAKSTTLASTLKPSSVTKTTTKPASSSVKTTTKISSVIKTTTKPVVTSVKTTAKTTSVIKTSAKPASSTIKTSVKTTSVIKTTTKPAASSAKTTAKTTSLIKTSAKPLSSTKTSLKTTVKTTAKTTSVLKTTAKTTIKAATPTGSQVCVTGTALDGHKALCEFSCRYGYCPSGPCTCTKYGTPVKPPASTGKKGKPKAGLDSSYLGLCSFGCDKGFCPSATCTST